MKRRIEINPLVCHGTSVIKGTRIPVSQIVGALAGGGLIDSGAGSTKQVDEV